MFKTARDMSKVYAESIYNRSDLETKELIFALSEKVERVLSTFSTMPYQFTAEEQDKLMAESEVSDFNTVAYGMKPQTRIEIIKDFFEALGYSVVVRDDILIGIDPETGKDFDMNIPAEIFISFYK